MKNFYCRILCILLVMYSYNAFATDSFYLRGDLGFLWSKRIKNKQTFYRESRNKRFKNGFTSSIGLGYKINQYFRTEISYNRVDNLRYSAKNIALAIPVTDITHYKQKLKLQAIMINAYCNIPIKYNFKPYFGVGLGYSDIRPSIASRTITYLGNTRTHSWKVNNSKNFTYALTTGLIINITKKFDLDISYKFQDFGKIKGFHYMGNGTIGTKIKPIPDFRINTHSIMAGIRYSF